MKWIDSHIHLDQYKEKEQMKLIDDVKRSSEIAGLIAVSMNYRSCQQTLSLAEQHTCVYPALGFHPEQEINKKECEEIYKLIEENVEQLVAIGEVGLPYYLRQEKKDIMVGPYIEILEEFVVLAKRHDLPIVLHAVYEDADLVCNLLERYEISRAHFHWFKGSKETMERMIQNGYYISITPDVLQKEKIRKIVSFYPLEYMMVETDGPWEFQDNAMTHPRMIHDVLKEISLIKNISMDKVAEQIYQNTVRFYGER
ncbi:MULTISPECIES: TatD family hydrolase [Bacillus cereus group]|uniref:TatD family deoxyribonuclease n=1 Tax=Bacillus cereus TaxID=1396 RepID=A0AA44QAZ9_BACCE|nr:MULTISPECIES: TatD family hydrolase [Bacillus cereus group]PFN06880.1 TatD family deoxyribonuclease [Bacillus cereus]PFO83716.1 TatD family deoxyribonuclease [Bacillus cereus]PFR31886.1 TatD family deoxyribonuclease [Bacillus cereus]PFS01479.1 TatD family deoxyribonuclease [Bacillus cereus]PGZ15996.1 TatD family deoxyribonuclease [Bacillus cereus]